LAAYCATNLRRWLFLLTELILAMHSSSDRPQVGVLKCEMEN
jgi:hypothetical protein